MKGAEDICPSLVQKLVGFLQLGIVFISVVAGVADFSPSSRNATLASDTFFDAIISKPSVVDETHATMLPYSTSKVNPFADQWVLMEYDELVRYLSPREITAIMYDGNKTAYSAVAATAASTDDSNFSVVDSRAADEWFGVHKTGTGFEHGYCWYPAGALYKHAPSTIGATTSNPFKSLIRKLHYKGIHDLVFKGDSISYQMYFSAIFAMLRFDQSARLPYLARSIGKVNATLEFFVDGKTEEFRIHWWLCAAYRQGSTPCTEKRIFANRTLLISNLGHHYHPHERKEIAEFNRDVRVVMEELVSYKNQGHIVMYRETNAQHFPFTSTGLYNKTRMYWDFNRTVCGAISNDSEVLERANWHNVIAKRIWKEMQLERKVSWIPFWESTVPRFDQHFDKSLFFNHKLKALDHVERKRRDCTHPCAQNPMIWMPIWHSINNNLDTDFN